MNIAITQTVLSFSADHTAFHRVEDEVFKALLTCGGTRIQKGVEIQLSALGIKVSPAKLLLAPMTVHYHNGVLQMYANPSNKKSLDILRFLKDNVAEELDVDPWHWWQPRKWRGEVSFLAIKISQVQPASSAK
jgi:hypothetical protein